MKMYLNAEEVRDLFIYVAGQVIEHEEDLTNLDVKIGDGDHGINMSYGFKRVLFELQQMEPEFVEGVFMTVGTAILDNMGGASGVLFGTMFISGVVRREQHHSMDLRDFTEIFRCSMDILKTRGKSKIGNKTMIDALEPAVVALEDCCEKKMNFPEALWQAAQAAREGMESTRNMKASIGRAKYYGDKAIGLIDPGAASVYVIFNAMAEWMKGNQKIWEYQKVTITTLNMNPCIDRTINVDTVQRGSTHKVREVLFDVSGKGINASIVLKNFGCFPVCLGFNYSHGARYLEQTLNEREIPFDLVMVPGTLRTNFKVFESASKIMTEFNESGQPISAENLDKLYEKIEVSLNQTNLLILSGSVPRGVPDDAYGKIIRMANEKGIRTILDASGNLLREGIKENPYLIKPNLAEFRTAFAAELAEVNDNIVAAAKKVLERGIHYICISLGKSGALFMSRKKTIYAYPLDVEVRGVQGAGDSMVAGFAMAIQKNATPEEMISCAVAAASGSMMHPGTQMCTLKDLQELLPRVQITEDLPDNFIELLKNEV